MHPFFIFSNLVSMKNLLFFALILSSVFGYSQASLDIIKRETYTNVNNTANQNYIRLFNKEGDRLSKNEFFAFNDWKKIKVLSKEKETLVIDSANYHFIDERMLFIKDGQLNYLFPREVDRIFVDDAVYIPVKLRDKTEYKYYELLVDGDLRLLKKHEVRKERVSNHPMGISHGPQKTKVKIVQKFYYHDTKKGELSKLPSNKKKIIKIFKKNKKRMLQYAKKHSISTNSQEDLVKLFSHYNNSNN